MASSRVFPSSGYNVHTFSAAAGKDYQSMVTWESDHTINLGTANKGEVLECYDDGGVYNLGASPLTIAGATRDGSNPPDANLHRVIYAPSGERHSGTPNTGFRIIGAATTGLIQLQEDYAQIWDTDIYNIAAVGTVGAITHNNPYTKTVGCLCKGWNSGAGNSQGIYVYGNGATVINTLVYECKTWGIRVSPIAGQTHYILNVTAINSGVGFRIEGTGGTAVLTNCLGNDNATADFQSNGTPAETVTYCLSKDTTADDWDGTHGSGNNIISTDLTFADAGGDDWHLTSADAALAQGTDLSGTFDDDIDFQPRLGTWDIGFDEFVPGGPICIGRVPRGSIFHSVIVR